MRPLSVLIPALAVLALAVPAQAQEQVGVNAAVRNQVQQRSGGAVRPAQVRGQVRLGDQYTTGPASQVQVLLRDRSTFTVGANARMTVDRFVAAAPRTPGGVTASVTKGAFRFASGKTGRGPSRQAITTPVASIGVRGTIVEGLVGPDALALLQQQPGVPAFTGDPETMLLVVLRGPVGSADTFDTPGAIDVDYNGVLYSLDQPGQTLIVTSEGVFGPFLLGDEASAQLIALLLPPPTSPDDSGSSGEVEPASVASGDTADGADVLPPQDGAEDFEPTPNVGDNPDGEGEFPLFPPGGGPTP
ncbi:MAG TPA: FecR family protein [Caulobacter sp.]|nr:FecR family protein [Caulobacter sp.]